MGKAQASSAVSALDNMPPCHQQGGNKPQPGGKGVMLYNDCAKADLSAVDGDALKKPDQGSVKFFVAWADVAPITGIELVSDHSIRAPPPEWRGLSRTRPSILLTTQRFRE